MKKTLIALIAALLALTAMSQQLSRFAFDEYDGWTYNNPNVPLNIDNITRNKITLYVNSAGLVLTLTSPELSCQDIDSIRADVKWKSSSTAVALTMALDDALGTPIDSAACYPPLATANIQDLRITLPVPHDLTAARVRFLSWGATVNNCGSVWQVVLTGIKASGQGTVTGDVTGDGNVNMADVTELIRLLLSGDTGNTAADVDGDGHVTVGDITAIIEILLTAS